MKVLALLTALPLTWAGGCCIASTTLSDGTEAFGTAEGTPAEACEGQWSDMSCSEFEQAYGVKSISDITNQAKSVVPIDKQSSSAPSPSSTLSPTLVPLETVPTPVPSFASIRITKNETSSEPPTSEEGPKLSFRFADISGCGALRTCTGCTGKTGCMWSDSGCTRSVGTIEQWCSPVARADTVKQPCESLTGCNQCTISAGCVWYRGSCSYSRGGCDQDPVSCINFAWQCPVENIPVVPWVQPGYGTYPGVGGQAIGGIANTYTPATQQFGMSYAAGNLAVSASGYVAPPYVPPSTSFQTVPYQPVIGAAFQLPNTISSYQPINPASYQPPNSAQSYQPFAQQASGLYPTPPNGPPSQLAVIGPFTPQSNTNSQSTSQLGALYPVVGPSPADASGLYPGAIVRPPQTNTVYSGSSAQGTSSAQSGGLYPSNTASQSSSSSSSQNAATNGQSVTSGLYPTSDFISASSIHIFSDTSRTPAPSSIAPSRAPTPSQLSQYPETLYSRPSNRQLQLPDPLPNRQQNAAISQYDVTPPIGELYQIASLINYDDFEQPSPTSQESSQPTPQPTSQSSRSRNSQQNQNSLYQPTNYIPFQYRPSQQGSPGF